MISNFIIYKIDRTRLTTDVESEILAMVKNNLKSEFDIPDGEIEFNLIDRGGAGARIKNYTFLGTEQDNDNNPDWFNFLDLIGQGEHIPILEEGFVKVKSSILSVFKIGSEYYIITFGNGFHSLPTSMLDENFGINLSKKLIASNGSVKGLAQSVIKGDLESTYKSIKNTVNYDAMLDSSNLDKKVKCVKGTGDSEYIFDDIQELQGLHLGLDGKRGLKISVGGLGGGGLNLDIFKKILSKINYFSNSDFPEAYKIPDLEKIGIDNSIYVGLSDLVKNLLISESNDIYFSPDLFYRYLFGDSFSVVEMESCLISDGENSINYSLENDGVFENLDFIKFLRYNGIDFNNLEHIHIKNIRYIDTDGEEEYTRARPKIIYLLQGEVEYNGDLYFFEGIDIYKPNQDFLDLVSTNFDEKIENFKLSELDFLNNWEDGDRESIFNHSHDISLDATLGKDGFYCFDKGVDMTYGLDGIEVCDLLKYINGEELYFIHVKKTHGADMRVVLSQGRVGTMKLLEDPERSARHIRNKSTLRLTATKIERKNFTVVYAIKNTKGTGIFTPYAKYDFLSTLEFFRNKGIDKVRFYNIN